MAVSYGSTRPCNFSGFAGRPARRVALHAARECRGTVANSICRAVFALAVHRKMLSALRHGV